MGKINDLIGQMTLEEKANMCSGSGFWWLDEVQRLGIPKVMVTDGPHGLRKQAGEATDHLGINESVEAVCYPSAAGSAASFSRELIHEMGEYLGIEAQAEKVSVLLGPGVNIKRSPLCGRNFEYFSEDPFVTGEMAASFIKGVQSKNVGTSMKHFAVNNQETRRMTSSSNLSERALREIYLTAFEIPVKEAKPWTIMSSYNRVNGKYVGETKRLLTDILRDEWGFDGYVVTDWGAITNRVESLEAGLDLQMPSSNGYHDKMIVDAVNDGSLDIAVLDKAVNNILTIMYRYLDNVDESAVFDRDAHHDKSVEAAKEVMVLLKNDGLLPLDKSKKIAFIGEFAEKPRYQGSGSSHINVSKTVSALDAVKDVKEVKYAVGFSSTSDLKEDALHNEAVALAKDSEVVVVFAGLPDAYESEGFDRTHMNLPACQDELIKDILAVNKNVVIVLQNGAPVAMPWVNDVNAILESYLAGQGVGTAQISILFGDTNPSAKLAETFPLRVEDNPSFMFFPGYKDEVNYGEDIFVGYRHYDTKKIDVLFPFGHGLSYTTFEYSNLKLDKTTLKLGDELKVSVDIKNTGSVFGKEVVQLYVKNVNPTIARPEKELKGFDKVALEPGETKTVEFTLNERSFAYYNDVEAHDWVVASGEYEILIGKSSRDIVLCEKLAWDTPPAKGFRVHENTPIGDIMAHPATKPVLEMVMKQAMEQAGDNSMMAAFSGGEDAVGDAIGDLGGAGAAMAENMMKFMPIRALVSFTGAEMAAQVPMLLGLLNGSLEEFEKTN